MSEQLSLDLSQPIDNGGQSVPEHGENSNNEILTYEALDYQLAKLLQQQNAEADQTLEQLTLDISKYTREGQIFLACETSDTQKLLNTKVVGRFEDYKPLVLEKGYLYLNRYYSYQKQLVQNISERILAEEKILPEWLQKRVNQFFESSGDETINWQQMAAEQALKQSFIVLSGGPGTGKTTTISRLLALLIEQHEKSKEVNHQDNLRILLAAPTGKAAIRLLDSLQDIQSTMKLAENTSAQMPKQASTLHKLLGYQANSIQFKHNKRNPLPADVVVIDEASMIDIAMLAKLFDAIPKEATFILVGDKDQLSSVEIGSVFTDICHGLEKTNKLITLQKNWRFSKDSGIGQLSKAINKGDTELALDLLDNDDYSDCSLVSPTVITPPTIPKLLIDPWQEYFSVLNQADATLDEIFTAFNKYRILCALRRGLNGSQLLSERIEAEMIKSGFIKNKGQQTLKSSSWYHGRPIMITQNSYSRGLYNGDVGIALKTDNQLKVYFPAGKKNSGNESENQGNYKSLTAIRLPVHETTWAMTIHKSQGSEFDHVTLVLPHEVMPLLTRQLIYTGVTRAKKHVDIIVDSDVLTAGITTEAPQATRVAEELGPSSL